MNHPRKLSILARTLLLIVAMQASASLMADDWPLWRGIDTAGVSKEKNLPSSIDPEKLHRVDLPEWGNSSPIIVADRVYLTAQTADTGLHVIAIDRSTRKIVWKKQVGKGTRKTHKLHNMASPSVVAEKDRVWALFGTGDLVCLDRDGKELWRRQFEKEHGEYKILWGMATSPILLGDRIFIVCQHGGPSYVLAIDKKTGKDLWKTARDLPCVGEAVDSYSTPTLARIGDKVELIVGGADHVDAYDPATGKQLWISSGLKIDHDYGRSIASPTFGEGMVVAASSNYGKLGRLIALEPGGKGDVSATRKWTFSKANPDCPTPVIYQGRVYVIRDDGVGTCMDLQSGKTVWTKRLFRGDVKASPVAGDGKVYFFSVRGEFLVVAAGEAGKELSRGNLPGQGLIATPAIADGAIWVRTKKQLMVTVP